MPSLLVVLFLVVPIVEIYVIMQVGSGDRRAADDRAAADRRARSAPGWSSARAAAPGAALTGAVETGRLPSRELADAALVLVGGTLLLTPGFVTDVFGFFLILPLTRPLARRALGWFVARRASKLVGARLPSTRTPRGSGSRRCPARSSGTSRHAMTTRRAGARSAARRG